MADRGPEKESVSSQQKVLEHSLKSLTDLNISVVMLVENITVQLHNCRDDWLRENQAHGNCP